MKNAPIEKIVSEFRAGALVVVTDDADRENEGDLIVAASHCTPGIMAFIIRHTSGIVCAPLSEERAVELDLPLMVQHNEDPHHTAFTVSVDATAGVTTGISATERCNTVNALASSMEPADFVRPGHIFPLIAKSGGVLERRGHTEAAVDLCRLAGLPEVAVISELVNDDGSVMKGAEIANFAGRFGLRTMSIADLVRYRAEAEGDDFILARGAAPQVYAASSDLQQ
ncbi:3,4-dihydroxy-2-butanone-4-phosphate synthase (plasmid) [Cupriavidus sp. P-10]|nr:3,4-dihydroxy-2-butanone-4-phosphate synthase [Cupriavidus sp. P-10]